jgi:hypothetical protein
MFLALTCFKISAVLHGWQKVALQTCRPCGIESEHASARGQILDDSS